MSAKQSEKLPQPQRFITTHNEDGKAVFEGRFGEEIQMVTLPDGIAFGLDYTTKGTPVSMEKDEDLDIYSNYLKNPPGLTISNGYVLRHVDIPPDMECTMHRTVSLDYGVVLEGQVDLLLDSGEQRTMKVGDVAIQRGTMHQWINRDKTKYARMLFVLVDCKPLVIAGKKLGEELDEMPDRVEELSDSDQDYEDMAPLTKEEQAHIAYLESVKIPIVDGLETDTSHVQDETLRIVLPYLEGNPNDFPLNIFGIPHLQKPKHVAFLKKALGDYPAPFAMMDASRPWLVYWSLQGLSALNYDISEFRESFPLSYDRLTSIRVIHTFSLVQYPDGGYGGNFGHLPHLAATYAAVLSILMVGGKDAYDSINRKSLWHFLGQLKQTDGGFNMTAGGEEDIRGAFCALVIMSLLRIPLELPQDAPARAHGLTSFLDNLGDWISKCQSFDGGISAAPGNEAHGAYAFCGLGALSIMGPPKHTLTKHLDMSRLVHWLSARQCAPEGGYNGRTNKLVDGCYSHWVGGCWSLVEAATTTNVWNRDALARYILSAAQYAKGGLIDKPGKRADAYHSCYNLAGLSAAQHMYVYEEKEQEGLSGGDLDAPYYWKVQGTYDGSTVWAEKDKVGEVHPIFVIPIKAVHECRKYFESKTSL
ncbi:CAAX farnesyltransferase (FTase) subunit beta [Kalmusia sp. IMI 367209]|nr:CAAX farnesyltransferase (FTase) subunit beta [Kalmusia sp. IMI 367209]